MPCPVSVCVPAHGSTEELAGLLGSLRLVDYPEDLFNVIVAIDGPDEALEATARHYEATIVVLPENRGSYAARNAALGVLPGECEVVLFTDADVRVQPNWVTGHLEALRVAHLSGGAVHFTMSSPPTPAELVDASRHLNQQMLVEALGYAATANVAVRSEVIEDLRFDPTLRSGGDRDFGYRAMLEGYRLVFTPGAWVTHPARHSYRALFVKVDRVARGISEMRAAGKLSPPLQSYRRQSPVAAAHALGYELGQRAALAVFLTDHVCNAIWILRAPSMVWEALRRRLFADYPTGKIAQVIHFCLRSKGS